MGPEQLKGVRRPQSVGSPIPDDRRAPGSDLGKTFSGPLLRKSFAPLAFFDLEEDFFACGRRSTNPKLEGFHKEKSTNQSSR